MDYSKGLPAPTIHQTDKSLHHHYGEGSVSFTDSDESFQQILEKATVEGKVDIGLAEELVKLRSLHISEDSKTKVKVQQHLQEMRRAKALHEVEMFQRYLSMTREQMTMMIKGLAPLYINYKVQARKGKEPSAEGDQEEIEVLQSKIEDLRAHNEALQELRRHLEERIGAFSKEEAEEILELHFEDEEAEI